MSVGRSSRILKLSAFGFPDSGELNSCAVPELFQVRRVAFHTLRGVWQAFWPKLTECGRGAAPAGAFDLKELSYLITAA